MANNSNSTALNPYNYTLSCGFSESPVTEEHIIRNVTNIDAWGKLQANGTYWSTSYPSDLILYWYDNKRKVNQEVGRVTLKGLNGKYDYAQVNVNFDVEHNDDGTLAGNLWCQFVKGSTTSIYAPSSGDISTATTTLTTIPRATVCPNISGIVEGSSINIALNPASSLFTHSIKVEFNKLIGYLNASGYIQTTEVILNTTSPIINFDSEYYAQFDKTSYEGKLIVSTYNGDTLIGSREGVLNISVDPNKCKPTAIGTVKDINSTTVALTGDDDVIVKGYSTALITPTITPSAAKDTKTTISKKYINGTEFTTSTVTVNGALGKDFELSMTNSRDITGTSILSATSLLEYIKASITAKFSRSSSTSTDMRVSLSGNFFDDYFDAAKTKKNKLTISWSVKVKGTDDDYTSGGTITSTNYTIENNRITSDEISLSNPLDSEGKWDSTLGYDFLIEYNDLLVSDSYKDSIKRGRPYFYWYTDSNDENHLVALDHLDVKGITKLQGDLYITDEKGENPKNVLVAINEKVIDNLDNDATDKAPSQRAVKEAINKSCMLVNLSDVSQISFPTSWTYVKVPLNRVVNSKGDKFTYKNNAVKMGKNVSKIKITANFNWYNYELPGDKAIVIFKNGEHVADISYGSYPSDAYYCSVTGFTVLDVLEGDLISLGVASGDTGSCKLFIHTSMSIEEL